MEAGVVLTRLIPRAAKVLRPAFQDERLSKLQALVREGSVSVARDCAHDLLRDASRPGGRRIYW